MQSSRKTFRALYRCPSEAFKGHLLHVKERCALERARVIVCCVSQRAVFPATGVCAQLLFCATDGAEERVLLLVKRRGATNGQGIAREKRAARAETQLLGNPLQSIKAA